MTKLIKTIFLIITYTVSNTDSQRLPEINPKNLSCYQCDSFSDTKTCITVNPNRTKVTYCPDKHLYCVVRQFSFLTNGTTKLWYLERTCKDECEDFCLGMGEKIRLFSCTKCCTDNLCNSGSGSETLILSKSLLGLGLVSLIYRVSKL